MVKAAGQALGATVRDGGVEFRVWAPRRRRVEVVIEGDEGKALPLEPEGEGYFAGFHRNAGPGTRYRYRLGGGSSYPDPASRFQPEGPEGPSEVIDPAAFEWTDRRWRGRPLRGLVLYEIHVGTFTPEGTWEAAARELPALADLGVNAVEIMPVAEFPGRFGWGYDGVDPFAPYHGYGRPDDFRRFVDRAHALGLGVVLDVVYNHFGPSGNFMKEFSEDYFTDRYENKWGESINFDGPHSGPVRAFFLANAAYWVEEFHVDGLRLDGTPAMQDASEDHILRAVARAVREAGGRRSTLVISEDQPQRARLARPVDRGGYGHDALWNEDFHHVAMVSLNRRREAYYGDYYGAPQEFVSILKRGFIYQGQFNRRQGEPRGTPALDLPPEAFVNYLQNHDQVANTLRGWRAHQMSGPSLARALTAVQLLAPQTPMLFQGQEFFASAPFLYFGDHGPEVAEKMWEGRRDQLAEFRSLGLPEVRAMIPNPSDPETFARCKLDPADRERNRWAYILHQDLLRLRREDPVFAAQPAASAGALDGAVLGDSAFVARYFGDGGDDRLLVVNLGRDLHFTPIVEPLLVAPEGRRWDLAWSSEDVRYGGSGTPPVECDDGWRVPGETAVVLRAAEAVGGDG